MSTTTTDGESQSERDGQPKPHGKVHPQIQEVESPVEGIASLRDYLGPKEDPICNWQMQSQNLEVTNVRTWFPNDENVAFYWPTFTSRSYGIMSYRDLHDQLLKCPSFSSNGTQQQSARVALVIPAEAMTETAVALLSIMARGGVAVPLDPRMPKGRLLEAMEQLSCTCLVSTKQLLLEKEILVECGEELKEESLLTDHTATSSDSDIDSHPEKGIYGIHPSTQNCSYFQSTVTDIRLISTSDEDKEGLDRPGDLTLTWTVLISIYEKP